MRRILPLRRRHLGVRLLAVASLVLGGGATALAVTGDDLLSQDAKDVHADPGRAERVVAQGTSKVGGPWRLTVLQKAADAQSPAGDCARLKLTAPNPAVVSYGTLLCRSSGKPIEFQADTVPIVNSATGDAETLVFGFAPRAAMDVEMNGPGLRSRAFEPGSDAFPAGVWLTEVDSSAPSDSSLSATGTSERISLAPYLDQLQTMRRSVKGG